MDGVRSALEVEDFEKAANCLKVYFDLEEQQQSNDRDALETQQAEEQKKVCMIYCACCVLMFAKITALPKGSA